jgi:hypothetical protein
MSPYSLEFSPAIIRVLYATVPTSALLGGQEPSLPLISGVFEDDTANLKVPLLGRVILPVIYSVLIEPVYSNSEAISHWSNTGLS